MKRRKYLYWPILHNLSKFPFFLTFLLQFNTKSSGKIITTNIEFIINSKLGLNTAVVHWVVKRSPRCEKRFFAKKRFIVRKVYYLLFYSRYNHFFSHFRFDCRAHFNYICSTIAFVFYFMIHCENGTMTVNL